MFNKDKVTQRLSSLVGFRPSSNPDFFVLTPNNLQSDSGYYINDNPFAELESYFYTINNPNIDEIGFNEKLEQLKSSAITSVCNAVLMDRKTPSFCDRQLQFKNAFNKINTETLPTSSFICERVRIGKVNSLAAKITRVLLDFQGTGDITLYLYNTNSIAPIKSELVTITSDHQVVELNWDLDNTDGLNGGDWYIGYYTDGLTVAPYEREYERASVESKIKFLNLTKTIVEGHNTPTLWDLELNENTNITTGMNLDITTYYNYSDLIIQNRFLFADAINLECTINMLNQYRGSMRSNKDQRITEQILDDIQVEIEGQASSKFQKVTGLRPSLSSQLALIRTKIDSLVGGYRNGRIKTIINV